MTVQEWLGAENTLGIDIWTHKYQYNNETFDEWLDRISAGDTALRQLIIDKKFLFGGRILANRGLHERGVKITYSNCYVITPPEDNIESIFECATKLARTYSYGGGCGVDISKLAPRGAKVNNAAKETSGSISFMDLYSMVTGLIGQGGRRGALMLSISSEHPDLEEFIDVKTDLNRVTSANISVRISDDFMKAVKEGLPYDLTFTREATGETVTKTVDARKLFEKLAKNNWDYAEPGCLFWDTIKRYNLLENTKEFEFAGTNPCLSGNTLIQTVEGAIPIKDLVNKQPWVYCMGADGTLAIAQAKHVWLTRRNTNTVTVNTSRGSIVCTPDHLIFTTNRGWVKASELRHGDKLKGLNRSMKDEKHVAVALSGGKYVPEHRFVLGAFTDVCGKDVHHIDGNTLNNALSNLEVLTHSEHSVKSNTGRTIDILRDTMGRFLNKPYKKTRDSFNQGKQVGTNWFVQSVIHNQEPEDVYDMSVPSVMNFVANDIVVHNCAEEPLPAGGSCLLGSLNLAAFVDANGQFDIVAFRDAVRIAVYALNDLLDEGLALHPLQEQRDSVRDWRQIGLGIMGLADMLISMGYVYGTPEAIELCNTIGMEMATKALWESSELARDLGAFPKCNVKEMRSTAYYQEHISEGGVLDRNISNYGLRNSQLLTIAPTGTLSTMLGVSGGIEPIFANYYERKTESLHGKDVRYKVYTPIVERYMKSHKIADDKDLPAYFITAQELNYEARIAMQSVWQKHIDASISSTVNVPHDFTVEDVQKLYIKAWESGLKGITIFRDRCKRAGVLTIEAPVETPPMPKQKALAWGDILQVNDNVVAKKRKLITGCGSLHCIACFDPDTGDLVETYLSKGSTGGCQNFMIGLSRMMSLAARLGADVYEIADQLNSTGACPSYAVRSATKRDTSPGSCCPMAVGKKLIEMYEEFREELGLNEEDGIESITQPVEEIHRDFPPVHEEQANNDTLCPVCKTPLAFEGGCNTCKNCGWSKCS